MAARYASVGVGCGLRCMMYPLCLESNSSTGNAGLGSAAQCANRRCAHPHASVHTQAFLDSSPLPMNDRERHWNASLREMRSFLIELMMSRRNSSFCTAGAGV